jgi:thioredoxin-like negative regulator of GroEL
MSQVRHPPGVILLCAGLLLGAPAPLSAEEVPWRYDYNAARKEAKEKNKPMVLDFGTANCHWCKQLDATTFRDSTIVKTLTERFIPVKVDASRDPGLAQALGITSFPTLVFAAPNGRILGQQDGYIEAAGLSRQLDQLFSLGNRAQVPSEPKAAAADRTRRARELLTQAREAYRQQNDPSCLDHCNQLATRFSDLPEAADAERLAAQIKNEPERLAQVCEKLTDSLGSSYVELAECLMRKGQPEQAISYLEKTVRTCPGTHAAQLAQERIIQIRDQVARKPEAKSVIRTQSP